MKFEINGRKKYIVYVDTDDLNKIKRLRRKLRWAMRFNKIIILPKGIVEIYQR